MLNEQVLETIEVIEQAIMKAWANESNEYAKLHLHEVLLLMSEARIQLDYVRLAKSGGRGGNS